MLIILFNKKFQLLQNQTYVVHVPSNFSVCKFLSDCIWLSNFRTDFLIRILRNEFYTGFVVSFLFSHFFVCDFIFDL